MRPVPILHLRQLLAVTFADVPGRRLRRLQVERPVQVFLVTPLLHQLQVPVPHDLSLPIFDRLLLVLDLSCEQFIRLD